MGNQTNSQDPQAINSRTFVGNLNTFQCTKTDVERMFQRYGRIAGEYPGREAGVALWCCGAGMVPLCRGAYMWCRGAIGL